MFDFLTEKIGLTPDTQLKILISLVIIVVVWVLRYLTLNLAWRMSDDARKRYLWKRYVSVSLTTLAMLLIAIVWLQALRQVGAFLGLLTAGLAIALKDPLTNLAGWLFIIIRKPFAVGDRIQIGDYSGDVIDIRLFQFTVLEIGNWVDADQSTGRVIHVPNSKVFLEAQANYTSGFLYIWNEIPVLLTFESDWKLAKSILLDLIKKHAAHLSDPAKEKLQEATKKYLITYRHLTPIVYTTVKDSGVLLTMRYLVDPRKRRGSEHEIWEGILDEFARHESIDFAYPTQRFYTQGDGKEGKDSAKN
jgi:small-conductance mechanosensitive channel